MTIVTNQTKADIVAQSYQELLKIKNKQCPDLVVDLETLSSFFNDDVLLDLKVNLESLLIQPSGLTARLFIRYGINAALLSTLVRQNKVEHLGIAAAAMKDIILSNSDVFSEEVVSSQREYRHEG